MTTSWTIFRKELADAVRDRRTWMIALFISLLSGPAVFLLVSNFVSGVEEKIAKREVVIEHAEYAPTLVNFLQRAGATIVPAPQGYRDQLRSGTLGNAVLVPPVDFEQKLERGEQVAVEAIFDDSHDKAQAVVRASIRLLAGFNRELGTQRLFARGVSPLVLAPLEVREVSLAPSQARGAQLLFIVPWAALMVAVFGALSVAIDVTAGERERGSLEPLLANPLSTGALVLGKWGVVMAYSVVIVVLTMAGFMVSMRLVTSETLSALMQLQWREVAIFVALLLPFAALMAAINMLAATFGRTYKEAQTYVSYIAMGVQFSAVVPVFLTVRDAPWQWFVPAIAQLTVLMRALRGDPVGTSDLVIPGAVCAAAAVICLALQARLLKRETIVFARS
ncbi:MAG TPA: ABC transporter permease subunit [Burkholderiaceae bacterium]|jgi:sodium transport system permease protein|nr:ABC transporter permease subunit [Burkholderiaceae bacterium]